MALALIGTGLSLSASIVVRHSRLVAEQRQYRMALDELSNQLELLAGLPKEELPTALERLEVSDSTAAHLPEAQLTGEVRPSDVGQQLALSITWEGCAKDAPPLSLSAWVMETNRSSRPAPAEGSLP